MGRHKFGGGAVRCEVCPNKVTHQNSIVVGRKDSGTARVIHKTPKCQQKWKQLGPSLMAGWPENREPPAPSVPLVPTKPAQEKRPDPPQPPTPVHQPTPVGEESHMARITGTPTPPRYATGRFVAFWKQETYAWVKDFLKQHPYKRGIVVQAHTLLTHTQPHLMLDSMGRQTSYKQFSGLVVMAAKEMNGTTPTPLRAATVAPTPSQPTPPTPSQPSVAPAPKLVPVDTRAIIAENNDLRKAIGACTQTMDAVGIVIMETLFLLNDIGHGTKEKSAAAHERLTALADLVKQR